MPTPHVTARCSTCFRTERWTADGTQVVDMEGGRRRPSDPAYRDAWKTLRAWQEGGPVVVGVCDMCAQPMVSTDPHATPITGWTLELPEARVLVGEWLSIDRGDGPAVKATIEQVDTLVGHRTTSERVRSFVGPISTLPFVAFCVALVLAMTILWLFTSNFFMSFIWFGFSSGGFVGGGYG